MTLFEQQIEEAKTTYGLGGRGLGSDEWWTPPYLFTHLGLRFDLDPCHPPVQLPWVPVERTISLPQDGLTAPWEGRVWLNPPYGRETEKWVRKLAHHGDGVALIFARTDAAWGQRVFAAADAVCFIAGRLSFIDGAASSKSAHNAGAPSALLAFGDECADAVRDCGLGFTATTTPVPEEALL